MPGAVADRASYGGMPGYAEIKSNIARTVAIAAFIFPHTDHFLRQIYGLFSIYTLFILKNHDRLDQ